ncbi:MAG: hypothetical protein SFV20_00225 [Sphingopyxis sp.]|nr:hypothetical protein [Sphingopyxis sp.]
MTKGRNFAMLMAVAGGLTVVAAPAGAVSCCGFSAPRSQSSGLHNSNSYESDAQREARLEKQRVAREARKAARAAKKAEEAKAKAAAAAAADTEAAN